MTDKRVLRRMKPEPCMLTCGCQRLLVKFIERKHTACVLTCIHVYGSGKPEVTGQVHRAQAHCCTTGIFEPPLMGDFLQVSKISEQMHQIIS